MFVKCLGSGDAFGSGGKFNTCFYVRTESMQMLLDCGATSLVAAKRQNLSPDDIDAILITHLHGDHFGGLPFFLCEIAAMKRRKKTLTIVGPQGIRERTLEALECMYPGVLINEDTPVRFQTYAAGVPLLINDIEVIAYKVAHSPESNPHCLRIAHGNKIVTYSGDTEWTDSLITASEGADLFICEATTYDIAVKQHLAVTDLMTKSSQIKARRIVLTHLADEALERASEIPFTIAADGMILMDEL
jgi:ribonuclease BN (tRNA processing enzyme)